MLLDHANKTVRGKIVYWGPAGSGKTQNLTYVWEKTKTAGAQGLSPGRGAAVAYEMLPFGIGEIRGYQTHYELFAVPGAAGALSLRAVLLAHVDGIVFVADARPERMQENATSLAELREGLKGHAFLFDKLPRVLQANKRDIPGTLGAAQVAAQLGLSDLTSFDAIAVQGVGVFDALKQVCKTTLMELQKA